MNASPFSRHASAKSRGSQDDRQGVAAVEMALVLPVLLIVLFGTINCSQLMFFRKSLLIAANQGLILSSYRDSTSGQVVDSVNSVLSSRRIANATITLTPSSIESAKSGDVINLQLRANYQGFGVGFFSEGADLPVTVSLSIMRE